MLGLAVYQMTAEFKLTLGRVYDHFSTRTGSLEEYESFTSSPSGRLIFTGASTLSHFRERKQLKQARAKKHLSASQEEDEVLDLDELDISYPGNIEQRSLGEYFEFAYLMAFHFLAEVTQAPVETSSLFACNTSLYTWRDDMTSIQRIYQNFEEWRPREKTANNVKPILFAHV